MSDQDLEILSAELIYSQREILVDFQERCEEAADPHGGPRHKLQTAAAALCRMLERQGKLSE